MIQFQTNELHSDQITQFTILDGPTPLTYADVIEHWINDSQFRLSFTQQLAKSRFEYFRFETPPVTTDTRNRPFEFVLLNVPAPTGWPADSETFRDYFTDDETDSGIVTFANLGRDATLVVPSPRTSTDAYGHLAAFVRLAPESQCDAFWRIVGSTLQQKIGSEPKWLSTAAGGVAWLHARIDDRPKYYGFAPYRELA